MSRRVLSSLFFLCLIVGPTLADDDERAKVPDAKEQQKAEAAIRDVFKAEFARAKAADKRELSAKLLQEGIETKDDPTSRFVLLRLSMSLAAEAGDLGQAMRAADELKRLYAVNVAELKAGVFERLAPYAKGVEENKSLAEEASMPSMIQSRPTTSRSARPPGQGRRRGGQENQGYLPRLDREQPRQGRGAFARVACQSKGGPGHAGKETSGCRGQYRCRPVPLLRWGTGLTVCRCWPVAACLIEGAGRVGGERSEYAAGPDGDGRRLIRPGRKQGVRTGL